MTDIPVDTTDDIDESDESTDTESDVRYGIDMDEELQEAIDILEAAAEDPDSVLACAVVVGYTDETEVTNEDGELKEGDAWRVMNPTAHKDFSDMLSFLHNVESFDDRLVDLQIQGDDQERMQGMALGELLG